MALHCSSWSDLSTEILEVIFDCTKDPIDVLRCGATCKSWLPTSLQVYQKFLPLCLIDHGFLFNILTKQNRKFQLPDEAKGRKICSSNNGWLLTMQMDATDFPSSMHLVNIFNRTQIHLPPIKYLYGCEMIQSGLIGLIDWKLFLSKSPLSSDCKVVVSYNIFALGGYQISSCKPGDRRWTNWRHAIPLLCDINNHVLYKDKIYISGSKCLNFSIFSYSAQRIRSVCLPVLEPWKINYTFLVKSEEDVLFVGCRRDQASEGKLFFVFEFDVLTEQLKEVNDLRGYALLLSPNTSHLLVKTTEKSKPSNFKANCIYFFRGHDYHQELVIYDLKTKDTEYMPCQYITKHANWINLDV